MWKLFALLSAVFAALTSILAKFGMKNVDSSLATALRTVAVLALAWLAVVLNGSAGGVKNLTKANWIFLILSGVTTGLSWLCYFKAIQIGDVSKVVPLDKLSVAFTVVLAYALLHERPTAKSLAGTVFIVIGTFFFL
ncbi:MAG: EamA family transporter [Treponema sp.]